MKTVFRQVIGYPGYEVGDDGTVITTKRGANRLLSVSVSRDGYHRVELWRGGRRKLIPIHHLVLLAFAGPRPMGHEARHLDGDPTNNRLGNLAWGTPKENQADRVRHGTANRGSRHGCAKLTEADVIALRAGVYGSPKVAAAKLGVSVTTAYSAAAGITWRHLNTSQKAA